MSEAVHAEIDRMRLSRTNGNGGDPSWSRGLEPLPKGMPLGKRVVLSSLTINLLSLGLPVAILQVYDRILPNNATQTLLLLVLGLVVVLILDSVLRMARSYVTGWSAARYEHMTACRAVDRVLASPVGDFERDAPGVHLDRLNAIDTVRDFNAGQARLILTDLPFVAIFIGLMWQIAGSLALVPLVLLGILAIAAGAVGFYLRGALEERAVLDDRRYNFIIEVLTGIQTVKGLAMEPLIQRRYERLQESGAASTYRCTFFSSLAQGIGSVFSSLAMVSVATIGALYVIAGDLSIGALAACTLLSARSVQPMLRALGLWAQFQSIQVARERLENLFSIEPETAGRTEKVDRLAGQIELKDVAFGYGDGPRMFEGLNLSVQPRRGDRHLRRHRVGQDDLADVDDGGLARPGRRDLDRRTRRHQAGAGAPAPSDRLPAADPRAVPGHDPREFDDVRRPDDGRRRPGRGQAARPRRRDQSPSRRLRDDGRRRRQRRAGPMVPNRASSSPAPWSDSRASSCSTKPTRPSTAEATRP